MKKLFHLIISKLKYRKVDICKIYDLLCISNNDDKMMIIY